METFHLNVSIGYYPLGSRWLVVIVDPPRPYGRFIKLKHSKASMKFDHRTCWKIISDVQIGRFETFCRFDSKFDLQSIRCAFGMFVEIRFAHLVHSGTTPWDYLLGIHWLLQPVRLWTCNAAVQSGGTFWPFTGPFTGLIHRSPMMWYNVAPTM